MGVRSGSAFGGMIGALGAAVVVWFGISFLWASIDGEPMPVVAYVVALVLLFLQPMEQLNDGAKTNLAAEQWGIVIVSGLYIYDANVVRWFF